MVSGATGGEFMMNRSSQKDNDSLQRSVYGDIEFVLLF